MDDKALSRTQDGAPGLELAMQELETLEAPGWWTAAGVVAGIGVVSVASYIGVTIATT